MHPRHPLRWQRERCDRGLWEGCSCDTPATHSELRNEPRQGCSYTVERDRGGCSVCPTKVNPRQKSQEFSFFQLESLGPLGYHFCMNWLRGFEKPRIRDTPSTAGNSMTGSGRPSPEPLLKKEAPPAVLGGR